jgi:hypothetical protein
MTNIKAQMSIQILNQKFKKIIWFLDFGIDLLVLRSSKNEVGTFGFCPLDFNYTKMTKTI